MKKMNDLLASISSSRYDKHTEKKQEAQNKRKGV